MHMKYWGGGGIVFQKMLYYLYVYFTCYVLLYLDSRSVILLKNRKYYNKHWNAEIYRQLHTSVLLALLVWSVA